ncbi:hypothetical protein [uncultured Ruegeria sp.]|uniref:hypothetical protein n=1 Tax=uncultured Ruegeria sp. TaxID=259304 RepID=UPI002637F00B|nr:hypothetical protein [uncultured Ruegeria sp.]
MTTKMQKLKPAVRLQILALGAVVLCCLASVANPENLRLAVISNMDDQTLDAFYNRIAAENSVVDPFARPIGIDDTDILVILLDNWADVEILPNGGPLDPLFANLGKNRPDTVRIETSAKRSSGTEFRIIAYALASTNYKSLACYAEDIAEVLRNNFDVLNSDYCQ